MKGTYPKSNRLKEIIESHRWTLFDTTLSKKRHRPYSWEESERMGAACQFDVGRNYVFAPIPQNGQTLRQAYTLTKGLGPSLTIENPDDERWLSLEVLTKRNGVVALFTRLFFHEECAFVTSPETRELTNPDFVAIRYDKLIDTFQRYFRIVTPEEYGLVAPIPMQHKLEDN